MKREWRRKRRSDATPTHFCVSKLSLTSPGCRFNLPLIPSDVHSRSHKPPAIVPKSPKLGKLQQSATVSLAHPNRSSRRNTTGAKEKPATPKSTIKSPAAKKPTKVPQHAAAAEPKAASLKPDTTSSPILTKGKKGKLVAGSPGLLSHGSPIRVPTGSSLGRVTQTDSSSDLSDCPSEPLSDEHKLAPAVPSDTESGTGSSDRDQPVGDNPAVPREAAAAPPAPSGVSQAEPAPGPHGENPKLEKPPTSAQFKPTGTTAAAEDDLLRELDELRSENDYLKVRLGISAADINM
ncbi:hypothetical protein XENOCAPTIV_005443 [Xenoophorus captivus]|uniref:Neuron navigator 1 n=1 Tax=Xenoophorus captivus TaxID=1517983 RepID=A0ABV0RNX2_9TELE